MRRKIALTLLMILIAFQMPAFAADNDAQQNAPGQDAPEMITMTFHWSSFDGIDLMPPLVMQAPKGSTFEEALQANGTSAYDPLFEKDGYTALLNAGPKPITDYDNYEDLLYAMVKDDDVMDADTELYYMMLINIDSSEATIEPPVSGTRTFTKLSLQMMGWDMSSQTNKPKVTAADGNHEHVFGDEENNPGTWWVRSKTKERPFIGRFKSGKQYMAKIWMEADYGYRYTEDTVMTVNNAEKLNQTLDPSYTGIIGAVVRVTAVKK